MVFFLIDQRPYVRFHAAQSIVVFLGLHVLRVVLGQIFGMGLWFGGVGYWGAGALLVNLLSLFSLILWIVLMVKAFKGIRFKLPVAGEIAERLAGQTA
jgi:uncharacterized membrane protein